MGAGNGRWGSGQHTIELTANISLSIYLTSANGRTREDILFRKLGFKQSVFVGQHV